MALVVVSLILAALLVYSAVRKLSHREEVVRTYARAGVAEPRLNLLAALLLAGAAGLVGGLAWAPLGLAAAIALACYFLAAVFFHVRAHDLRNLPTPLVYLALAIIVIVLNRTAGGMVVSTLP
ncbi:DoxX family protein [Nonomuraea sp. NPDC050663]|uniref:DoxX family protein n=1 Tax=Nonomuraea sp. NPDC050663 TaxID=3364370 RepID=UPI0037AB7233